MPGSQVLLGFPQPPPLEALMEELDEQEDVAGGTWFNEGIRRVWEITAHWDMRRPYRGETLSWFFTRPPGSTEPPVPVHRWNNYYRTRYGVQFVVLKHHLSPRYVYPRESTWFNGLMREDEDSSDDEDDEDESSVLGDE